MIRNCFNYVGSKDRILPLVEENLDGSKKIFVDLFCGSGVVGLNQAKNYKSVYLNDACWQVTETLQWFQRTETEQVLALVKGVIKNYGLSKTNKEGFLKLREYYNEKPYLLEYFEPEVFYALVTHAFNFNIHINSEGKFSVPSGAGRCYFNPSLEKKLIEFQSALSEHKSKISILNLDFKEAIKASLNNLKDTMFYVDPPYLSSDSSYGRVHYLGKWNEDMEKKLITCLEFINEKGGSFLLSNVLENNGKENKLLSKWAQKYTIVDVRTSYDNCNYQRKNAGNTREVLVRNY